MRGAPHKEFAWLMRRIRSRMFEATSGLPGRRRDFLVQCQAKRIILARATIKYGNVYLLARRSNSSRSFPVRTILYGLLRGKFAPSQWQHNREAQSHK